MNRQSRFDAGYRMLRAGALGWPRGMVWEGGGRGFRMGNMCTFMVDSCWCMAKPIQYCKVIAAAAKLLQSCPTLCDPIDSSPPGSPVPGILQARTLEWVAISFSNAWKWKWKGSRSVVSDSSPPHGPQPTRLLCPWDFPGNSTGVGCYQPPIKINKVKF